MRAAAVVTARDESVAPAAITSLPGVGAALAAQLADIGVHQIEDLLFVLPLRYEDRTRLSRMGSLVTGQRAVVSGEVQLAEVVFRRRRQLLVRIDDGSGSLTLRFFYFSNAQRDGFARGSRIRCYGEVRRGPSGFEMVHPEYQRLGENPPPLPDRLTPVYPSVPGIAQGRFRRLIDLALQAVARRQVHDWLPAEISAPLELPGLGTALRELHHPPLDLSLNELASGRHPAQRRLAFEELLAQHLALQGIRNRLRQRNAPALVDTSQLAARLARSLPFSLTGAQRRALDQICADLQLNTPMARLLQGDVGSGKTAVAAIACAQAIGSAGQAALMAPTELLAEQHWQTLHDWFAPLGVTVTLVTGTLPAAARRKALASIADGKSQLIVGTHALFQQGVAFARLALVIVDEQHRFGVDQRLQLAEKAAADASVHQLIMTATPIPRTLAMTAYADLDVTVLDELPPGRTPVRTVVLPETRRAEVVERIAAACAGGSQAYWVCSLIEESEELKAQAAQDTAAALTEALPQLRVALVHGRLKPRAKEKVMREFKAGEIELLVATTVIEVGVDVPNATLMIIENAERMGLAQLHQLRGRVGRGRRESSCVLLYRAPLGETARERLNALRETNDGFVIAERDLQLRGAGELLGTRQTGLAQLRVADLARDVAMLPQVQRAATVMNERFPGSIAPLVARWVGASAQYGRVG
ncbi:MAG: ATP-dependent DNA helicase RecG [Steroidobacteraceae bacterium]